jgi:hypothetical protein
MVENRLPKKLLNYIAEESPVLTGWKAECTPKLICMWWQREKSLLPP